MARKEAEVVVTLKDRASRGLRRMGGVARKLGKAFGIVTAAASAVTAIVGARFFAGAIRSAGQFDEAMQTVGVVTGATADELQRLRDTADEAGTTTRFTATEAAQGLEELARAGQTANESIATLNPVLDLAAGNNQTVAESAIQVTTALNAFGLAAEEAGRVSDVYTRAAQRSAQTTGQLGEAMTFVAPVARQAGLEIEQTAALVGRLADAGFRGSMGGTALRNAILQFQDPASNFRAELERLGIETNDFIEAMGGLAGAGDDAEAAIRSLGLRAGPAIQALVAGGQPALQDLIKELNNAEGASDEAAAAMEDNLPGALRSLGSAFDAARRRLVEPLVENITEQVQRLAREIASFVSSGQIDSLATALAGAFDKAAQSVRDFLSDVDFTAVTQRLTTFVNNAGQRIVQLQQSVSGLGQTARNIASSVQIVVGVIGTLFNTLGVVIGSALEFVGGAIQKYLGFLDTMTLGTIDSLGKIRGEFEAQTESIARSTEDFARKTGKSVDRVVRGWEDLSRTAEDSAARQSRALDRTSESQDKNTQSTRESEAAQEGFREATRRSLAAVQSWDEANERATETVKGAGEAVGELGTAAQEAGDDVGRLGDTAEESTAKVKRIGEAVSPLQEVAEAAVETSAAFDGVAASIESASTTTQLNALAAQVQNLAAEGALTAEEVRLLVAAIEDQAEAMDEAASSTSRNTDAVSEFGSTSREAASDADDLNRSMDDGERAGESFRGSMFGITSEINRLKAQFPELADEIDRISNSVLDRVGFSFQGFARRGSRALREIREVVARFERDQRDANAELGRTTTRLDAVAQSAASAGREVEDLNSKFERTRGAEITQRLIVEFRRDQGEQVVLSESQISRIAGRVLSMIDSDQERTA